jgi:hypothetical protein
MVLLVKTKNFHWIDKNKRTFHDPVRTKNKNVVIVFIIIYDSDGAK